MTSEAKEPRVGAAAGLCAMVSWCFQAPQPDVTSDDDAVYMTRQQQQLSQRSLSLFRSDSASSSAAEPQVELAGYQEPPRWVKDTVADVCAVCDGGFDLFNRRHHCRGCGRVCCAKCASQSDRVVKFGFLTPVRLCTPCAAQAARENEFYETHLPLLEAGEVLNKHGLLRKRAVQFRFIRSKSILQYQRIDMELRQFHGDIKAISLDMITSVREAALDKENPSLGFVIVAGDEEHRFDAPTALKRTQWVQAIRCARDVRNALIASEREKRARLLAQENDEIKKMADTMRRLEDRKASFHEDRLRKRAERRESLRAKYSVSSATSAS